MNLGSARFEFLYTCALRLYPAPFCEKYGAAMQQAFRDALGDSSLSRGDLILTVLRDLLTSIVKEQLLMLREVFFRPALIFNALVLTGLATVLALALYAIPQQVLRRGADDPQVEMADNLVGQLEQGVTPGNAVPADKVEIAHSLSPFVIAFDDQGHPIASQAVLNGGTPTLPKGTLDYAREHGEYRFTWRPAGATRIAAVVQRVHGNHPGFVLAGRSLREESVRQIVVKQMATLAWISMLALILVGTAAFGWYTRPRTV
ncbi:MAG: hypothetical protein ACLPY1_19445 [Terracidiphilus sp.]